MEDRRSKYRLNNSASSGNATSNFLDIKFDVTELNIMCNYIVSENRSIRRGNIINLKNTIDLMDMNQYNNNPECLKMIDFIKKGISARLDKNLSSSDLILKDICGGLGVSNIDIPLREINNSEVDWINQATIDIIKFKDIQSMVDTGLDVLTKFKAADYGNRGDLVNRIESWNTSMQNLFRKDKVNSMEDMTFSLIGNNYVETMQETYRQLTSPSNCLRFGVQGLNLMTGGGLLASRVYILLGLPGEGKSSTLLDMAIQLKKYNKNYKCKDPTKRPCVVLLIMENSIKETVQRLFSMCMLHDMTEYTETEAIERFRTEGLHISDDDPIDLIIKFRPNLSEDTSYLYTLTDDLEDQGYEVICMIQDYLKRIRSVDGSFGGDIRLQLGAIVNEFKTFATIKDIPVVTASQLNRTASTSIDTARAKNKSDLVRMIGRSNVGESNLIIENGDWIALIAPEMDRVTGKKYLGIQRVKTRYYISDDFQCIYLPYIDGTIKFVEDFYSPLPVHKFSMTPENEMMMNAGISNNVSGGINPVQEFSQIEENGIDNIFDSASAVAAMHMNRNRRLIMMTRPVDAKEVPKKKLMYRLVDKR